MDQQQLEQFMRYIERHTSLSADDILGVVQSLDHAEFNDETTVHGVSSPQLEDMSLDEPKIIKQG